MSNNTPEEVDGQWLRALLHFAEEARTGWDPEVLESMPPVARKFLGIFNPHVAHEVVSRLIAANDADERRAASAKRHDAEYAALLESQVNGWERRVDEIRESVGLGPVRLAPNPHCKGDDCSSGAHTTECIRELARISLDSRHPDNRMNKRPGSWRQYLAGTPRQGGQDRAAGGDK